MSWVVGVVVGLSLVLVPYKYFSPPVKDRACVRVIWAEPQRVSELCDGGGGCWKVGGRYDLIIASQPKDFNDEYRLMVLGHEFFHVLGAEHD